MKLKAGILFLLSLIFICMSLVSCKKDEEPTPDENGDDFSGSIAPEDENTGNGSTETEEQIDEGDPDATYDIYNAEDLKSKLKMKGTYVLKADIDLQGAEWKPVGNAKHPFSGTFDGGNFKITNFKITDAPEISTGDVSLAFKYAYSGFFGVSENATVKDVTFDGVSINVKLSKDNTFLYAAPVIGYAKNTSLTNVKIINASVTAQCSEYATYVGGIAGYMQKGSLTGCSVNGSLFAKESVADTVCGGIVGATSETGLKRCEASGSVSSVSKYGKSYAGGLIGYCSSSKISQCISSSEISATVSSSSAQTGKKGSASAGGFAAIVTASSFNKRTEFSECYTTNTCTVTAIGNKNAAYSGGFAASSEYGIFTQCYSRANVTADSSSDAVYAAGLIAYLYNQKDVENALPYPYDTRLNGCFTVGVNVTVRSATAAYFMGTLVYSDLSVEGEQFIISSGYDKLNFYVNSDTPNNDDSKIQKNGSDDLTATVYGSLTLLKNSYGWNTDAWEMTSGFPTLKPEG